ncbi:hypothetical protein FRX31_021917 [Thalictrum thalictroides]|uniref:Uncharacterized protein n=1 Tax=Thalictrum thalictroides TaxID=46969 RepID=A0A7J6VWF7_THATH|nr:hypothetical protein FRX31_021917 [Thalictrum thalictroides]
MTALILFFFHLPKLKHHYFPCINPLTPNALEEYLKSVVSLPKIDYSPESEYSYKVPSDKERFASSPFSVRISNYSSEDDENKDESKQVDDDAEAFIKSFYEQLRAQSHIQLLQYQEMLSRGTHCNSPP